MLFSDDISGVKENPARNSCLVEDDGVSVNVLLQVRTHLIG